MVPVSDSVETINDGGNQIQGLLEFSDMRLIQYFQCSPNMGAGNTFGAWQVDDFAVFFQLIKTVCPVATHSEYRNFMLFYIADLLFPACFRDSQIDAAQRADYFDPVDKRDHGLLALEMIEFIRGYADYQAISQRSQSLQQPQVTDMEQIEGTVGQDGFHGEAECM